MLWGRYFLSKNCKEVYSLREYKKNTFSVSTVGKGPFPVNITGKAVPLTKPSRAGQLGCQQRRFPLGFWERSGSMVLAGLDTGAQASRGGKEAVTQPWRCLDRGVLPGRCVAPRFPSSRFRRCEFRTRGHARRGRRSCAPPPRESSRAVFYGPSLTSRKGQEGI